MVKTLFVFFAYTSEQNGQANKNNEQKTKNDSHTILKERKKQTHTHRNQENQWKS